MLVHLPLLLPLPLLLLSTMTMGVSVSVCGGGSEEAEHETMMMMLATQQAGGTAAAGAQTLPQDPWHRAGVTVSQGVTVSWVKTVGLLLEMKEQALFAGGMSITEHIRHLIQELNACKNQRWRELCYWDSLTCACALK